MKVLPTTNQVIDLRKKEVAKIVNSKMKKIGIIASICTILGFILQMSGFVGFENWQAASKSLHKMMNKSAAPVFDRGPLPATEKDNGVIIYEVKDGDTVENIAAAHHVDINTILWANGLDSVGDIFPGDKIFILPSDERLALSVSVFSYVVKKGDTIENIAEKYKLTKEELMVFNHLVANESFHVGEKIIIPNNRQEIADYYRESFDVSDESMNLDGVCTSHLFLAGNSDWYAASRRCVPWGGSVGIWLYRAKVTGYATGRMPKIGSVMVSAEPPFGHAAFVEKINGSVITVSEMSYVGMGQKNMRTLDYHNRIIKGFIYY